MFFLKKTLCRQIYLSVFMSEKCVRKFWNILVGITHYTGTEAQLMKSLTGALIGSTAWVRYLIVQSLSCAVS